MIKNTLYLLVLAVFVAFFASCQNASSQTTPLGVRYKKHVEGTGTKASNDTCVIEMHLAIYTSKDSMLRNTYKDNNGDPIAMLANPQGSPLKDLTNLLAEGDSLTVLLAADSIYKEGTLPPFIQKGSDIRHEIKIVKVYTSREAYFEVMNKRMQEKAEKMKIEAEKAKVEQEKVLAQYVADKGLKATKTESGLYYIVEKEGTGNAIKAGDNVSVHYTGTLLDGTKFDSSLDRTPSEPLTFPVGLGQVIRGWDEGIMLFKKGGKGTLLIPSYLAYGIQGAPPVIKPNSSLIFTIEIVDVKKGEATQGNTQQGN